MSEDTRPYKNVLSDIVMDKTEGTVMADHVRGKVEKGGKLPINNIKPDTWIAVELWIPKIVYETSESTDKQEKYKTFYSQVTSDYDISIPEELMEEYDIRVGDFIQADYSHMYDMPDKREKLEEKDNDYYNIGNIPTHEDIIDSLNVSLLESREVKVEIIQDIDCPDFEISIDVDEVTVRSKEEESAEKGTTIKMDFEDSINNKILISCKWGSTYVTTHMDISEFDDICVGGVIDYLV